MPLHRSQFIKEVKQHFLEITDSINAELGLLHLEMTVFHLYTQEKINQGDEDTVIKCFELASRYFRGGNNKLRNAIDVSFVEGMEFSDNKKKNRRWAWNLLPEELKALYIKFHGKSAVS